MSKPKPKIAIVTTMGVSLDNLFPDFYPLLQAEGFEVVGICAADRFVDNVRRQGVRVIEVPMTRTFTPFRDFVCLVKLYRIFRAEKFDLIHYNTPKAAVLSAIAGRFAGSSKLLYTLRGLAYTGFQGLGRCIGRMCEKICAQKADDVIAISQTLKQQALEEGIIESDKVFVLGAGSSKGVDLKKFRLDERTIQEGAKIRKQLSISEKDVVFGYAGRFTVEKGFCEIIEAFNHISQSSDSIHLLFVGEQDERMPLPPEIQKLMSEHPRIHLLPYTDDVPSRLAAIDVFVLASYREGFGNVLIEASALERPVIASDIPGCRSAVKPNVTGLLVSPRDVASLESAMQKLIADRNKRLTMGKDGRAWVESDFDRNLVWQRLIGIYKQLLRPKDYAD